MGLNAAVLLLHFLPIEQFFSPGRDVSWLPGVGTAGCGWSANSDPRCLFDSDRLVDSTEIF
jgi:hypothetical protein